MPRAAGTCGNRSTRWWAPPSVRPRCRPACGAATPRPRRCPAAPSWTACSKKPAPRCTGTPRPPKAPVPTASATLGSVATAGTTTQFSRQATLLTSGAGPDSRLADAAAAEERLQRSLRQGGLLVLTVHPRLARRAEAELLQRFRAPRGASRALQRLNFDALLLERPAGAGHGGARRLERGAARRCRRPRQPRLDQSDAPGAAHPAGAACRAAAEHRAAAAGQRRPAGRATT